MPEEGSRSARPAGKDDHGPLAYFAELLVYRTDEHGIVIPGAERQWEGDLTVAQFRDLLSRYAWVPSIARANPEEDDSASSEANS